MGINTLAYLPSTADLGDVALAIQKLTDADSVEITLAGYNDGIVAAVSRGSDYGSRNIFNVEIKREAGLGDKRDGRKVCQHSATLHLAANHQEWSDEGQGKHLITGTLLYCGSATAWWVALSKALVEFFGGVLDINDCDGTYADVRKNTTAYGNVKDGDAAWVRKQKAVNALQCVTAYEDLIDVPGTYNRNGNYTNEKAVKV